MITTDGGQRIEVNLVGSSKFGKVPKISAEKTYNMYITDGWLANFPGYQRMLELETTGPGRAAYTSNRGKFMIVVVKGNVYRIDGAGLTKTLIGSLDTASGEVYIAENLSNQICIVDGINAYIYNWNLAPNLTKQVLSAGLIPNYVCYHNTFFLFGNGTQNTTNAQWFAYKYLTDTTIQLESTLQIQTKPDYPVAVERLPGRSDNVIVFGRNVCEIHTNIGGVQNYRRNSSISIDYGCLSVSTIAVSEYFVMWLAANQRNAPVLMLFDGQQAKTISTDGISFELERINYPEMSTASFHTTGGHLQYIITFYHESDNVTYMFDTTSGQFFHLSDGKTNYFPSRQFCYLNNETYFVSLNTGSLYKLDDELNFYNENLESDEFQDPRLIEEIPRIRIMQTIRAADTQQFRVNLLSITLDMGNDDLPPIQDCIEYIITENGIMMVSEDGAHTLVTEDHGDEDCESEPYRGRIDLAFSTNGGETYTNYVSRQTNPIGQRRNIVRWEKMGLCNEFTPKIKFHTLGRVIAGKATLDTF